MMSMLGKSILQACVVALMAVSIVMVPANAAAMLSCEDAPSEFVQADDATLLHSHEHGQHDISAGDDSDHLNFGSVAEHCGGHVCVVGVELQSTTGACAIDRLSRDAALASLVSLTSPEDLLRPPRP